MKLLIQKDFNTKQITGVYKTQKEAAQQNSVTPPAINLAMKRGGSCGGKSYEWADVDDSKILNLILEENAA